MLRAICISMGPVSASTAWLALDEVGPAAAKRWVKSTVF